jgi:hypothetical protein
MNRDFCKRKEVRLMAKKRPSLSQIREWLVDGSCEATDGCIVEPDGTCEHGCQSWLLVMGMI